MKKTGVKKVKKGKKKLLTILLVMLLLFLAVGVILAFFKSENSGAAEVGLSTEIEPSPLLLQASQNYFRVYKGAQTELTVTSRQIMEGTVTITDQLGENLLTLELKDGTASGTIGVFEEEPRCIELTASVGEEKSQPLSLYVAPEVTAEMIVTCCEVTEELGQELLNQGFEKVDEEAVAVAKKWLEADERVEAVVQMDNGVFYYTRDGIAGACMHTPQKDSYGGTLFSQEDSETLITYSKWETGSLNDYQYLWSDNTLTNDRIMVLRPRYDAYMNEEQAKEQSENDKCIHNESHAEIAREIAVKLEVNEPEIYSDMEAVAKIIDGDMNEYGIILINTHGWMIGPDSLPEEEKLFTFQLSKLRGLRRYDELYTDIENVLGAELGIEKSKYSMFFTKYEEDALANLKHAMIFISVADLEESLMKEKENKEAGITEDVLTTVGLQATHNLITAQYQNKMFDNSIIYWGVCYSMANTELAQFFIDHEVAACTGYYSEADYLPEKAACKAYFENLTKKSKNENRMMNIQEACEAFDSGVAANRSLMIFAREFNNQLSWLPMIEKVDTDQTNMLTMAEPIDYVLKGQGTLTGTVQMDQTGEPIGGAAVELYRWLDQEFVLMDTTSTDGRGKFKTDEIPWGVYVAKVTTEEGTPAYANCIHAEEKWDAGTILITGMSPYYQYIKDELEPKLGLFELGEKKNHVSDLMTDQGWDTRTGILSAAIQDMNGDDVEDMLLLRVEMEMQKMWMVQTLYADVYTQAKGEVIFKDSVKIDTFNNCEIHDLWTAMYDTGDGQDFFFQSFAKGVLIDYQYPYYGRYRFDGEKLRKVFVIEQTGGGTTEKEYTNTFYDEAIGEDSQTALWRDEMLWGWDGPALYNSWGYNDIRDMYQHFLDEHMAGDMTEDIHDYPSYIGSHGFTSIARFVNEGTYSGDFTMTVDDYTDLRGALKMLP